MKELRNTVVLVLVFAALYGYLALFSDIDDVQPMDQATRLTDMVRSQLDRVEVRGEGEPFVLERVEEAPGHDEIRAEGWRLRLGGDAVAVDPEALDTLTRRITALEVARTVDTAGKGPEEYGLDNPLAEIRWEAPRAERARDRVGVLRIGDKSPIGSFRYVALEGRPEIYAAKTWEIEPFLKGAAHHRDKRVLPSVDAATLERIEVTLAEGETPRRVLARRGQGDDAAWFLEEPVEDRADLAEVRLLIADMRALRAESFLPETTETLRAFELDEPRIVARFLGPGDATRTLRVGGRDPEKPNRVAVRVEDARQPVTVAADLLDRLAAPLIDLRDDQVLETALSGVDRLTLSDGAASVTAERSGEGWALSDGAPVGERVEDLLETLRGVKVSRWEDNPDDALVREAESPALTLEARTPTGTRTLRLMERAPGAMLSFADEERMTATQDQELLPALRAFLADPRAPAAEDEDA